MQAVYGLGGIGKTQVALEYCYRHKSRYAAIFWIGADFAGDLQKALSAIQKSERPESPFRGGKGVGSVNPAEVFQDMRHWLQNHVGWLAVFDNVDDLTLLKPVIPREIKGDVLLTSRAQVFQLLGRVNAIELDTLPANEAKSFILHRTNRTMLDEREKESLEELIRELQGLPLALEQACAYIVQNDSSFSDYLNSYQKDAIEILSQASPIGYEKPIELTWKANFEKVSEHRGAAEILFLSAFVAPDNIPFELLTKGAQFISNLAELRTAEENTRELNETLAHLTDYSLIRKDRDSHLLSIHRLVQLVIQHGMTPDKRLEWVSTAVTLVNLCFPEPPFQSWTQCERMIPHAFACEDLINKWRLRNNESEELLKKLAKYLTMSGKYAGLETLYESLIRLQREKYGVESLPVLVTGVAVSRLYKDQGRFEDAQSKLVEVHAAVEKQEASNQTFVAEVLNLMALLSSLQGDYGLALERYQKVLDIYEHHMGRAADDSDLARLARVLQNLGIVCRKGGQEKKALIYFKRAEKAHKRSHGVKDADTGLSDIQSEIDTGANALSTRNADDAYDLGTVYESQGQYQDAERSYKVSLKAAE